MEEIRIVTNKELADLIADEEVCAKGITAIAVTSRTRTAVVFNLIAEDCKDMAHFVWHEAIDTETPSHPRAFTQAMAQETLSTLREAELRGDMIVLGCDDGQSRAPAIAAAWTRIRGYDDLDYQLDSRQYYPNALIYARMLETAGYGHIKERSALRKMMKEIVMAGITKSTIE